VSYESLTRRTRNSETFPSGLCLPFLPSHSVCRTYLSHWFNFTTVYIAPVLITLKTAAIHPTRSISSPQQKVSPPATQSCLLPPPWLSCSQAAAARPLFGQVAALRPVNPRSNNSSYPHSPGLHNWQSNRSSDQSVTYIYGPSGNLSNPHSPGLGSWQSDGANSESKGSSSGIYDLETDDGRVPQDSGGGSSSSKG
jgi:hypothetical protein